MKFANGIGGREAEILKIFLHSTNHRGRTTDEKFAVSLVGVLEVLFDVVLGDEANATFPARRGIIEDKEDLEAITMEPGELL